MVLSNFLRDDILLIKQIHNEVSFSEVIDNYLSLLTLTTLHKKESSDSKYADKAIFINNPLLNSYHFPKIELENIHRIIALIGFAHQKRKDGETTQSFVNRRKPEQNQPSFRKKHGVYYTNFDLARLIVRNVIAEYLIDHSILEIKNCTFFEPCVGIGVFVFAFLYEIREMLRKSNKKANRNFVQSIVNNIFVADLDIEAIEIYKKILPLYVDFCFDIEISTDKIDRNIVYGGLLWQKNSESIQWVDTNDIFSRFKIDKGFDFILTNPPYSLLRVERNDFLDEYSFMMEKEKTENIVSFIRSTRLYCLANEGVINTYKLFVEDIVRNFSHNSSYIGLLIPATMLADLHCTKLRKYIFNYKLGILYVIPEKNEFFEDITQSFLAFTINKGKQSNLLTILPNVSNIHKSEEIEKATHVDLSTIRTITDSEIILQVSSLEKEILCKMHKFPNIKELAFLVNLRGELDLTLDKKYISAGLEGYPLVRGQAIAPYKLITERISEKVLQAEFLMSKSAKKYFVSMERIACQQVSNLKKEQRLAFCYIPSNHVLANSCNFIHIRPNAFKISYQVIMGILNSSLLNWRFKLTSSNNHINNYEIDELPIPVDEKFSSVYLQIADIINWKNENIPQETAMVRIDALIFNLYNLTQEETIEVLEKENKNIHYINHVLFHQFFHDQIIDICIKEICNIPINNSFLILKEDIRFLFNDIELFEKLVSELHIAKGNETLIAILEKYFHLYQGRIFNHLTSKLSDLDLEMIRNVPPGGNWQDIPDEIIKKSKRLTQIKKSGGRTTYYGRLCYERPSYTISTYFNRPGNGTYVHPDYFPNNLEKTQNRLISFREAARIQSFPDKYRFLGSKASILKQIGNAVPPLLAYSIGLNIFQKTKLRTAIDLFCGAGGLSEGLKQAGIKIILANDNFVYACDTYRLNHPETKVVVGDITENKIKDQIIDFTGSEKTDIVIGGPPCQGFSHAGKRMIDDPRNKLFKEFINVIQRANPSLVLLENVEGIMTINEGRTYREIISLFEELGYRVKGAKLNAANYGVPQKRKRVIIMGVRESVRLNPSDLFPEILFSDNVTKQKNLFKFVENTRNSQPFITVKEAISDLPRIEMGGGENITGGNDASFFAYQLLMKDVIGFTTFLRLREIELIENIQP